jgi:precorrin-2 methylase
MIGSSSLNFNSFSGLFLVTGVASTSALLIALMMTLCQQEGEISIEISPASGIQTSQDIASHRTSRNG